MLQEMKKVLFIRDLEYSRSGQVVYGQSSRQRHLCVLMETVMSAYSLWRTKNIPD